MKQPQEISVLIAFVAGFLSFISPCVLPLVPSYLTYITGVSFKALTLEEKKGRVRWVTISHSLLFIAGFSMIFILMGASASYVGSLLAKYQYWLTKAGGILIIILGIQFTGIINIRFLQMEKRIELREKPLGYVGSFLWELFLLPDGRPALARSFQPSLFTRGVSQDFTTGVLSADCLFSGTGCSFFSLFPGFQFISFSL